MAWWFAAPLVVWGVKEIYDAVSGDSSYSYSSSSNEDEVRENYKEEKREKLEADLKKYTQREISKIKNNYNTIIKVDSFDKIKITRKDQTLQKHIKSIEKDITTIEETITLLKELQSSNTKLETQV